jgi:hypothetical protein
VAEQSHKREMSDALRGDFERLRRRLEGGGERTAPPVTERPSEPLVLTPPRAEELDPEAATEPEEAESGPSGVETVRPDDADDDEGVPVPSRSRLRSIFRRG